MDSDIFLSINKAILILKVSISILSKRMELMGAINWEGNIACRTAILHQRQPETSHAGRNINLSNLQLAHPQNINFLPPDTNSQLSGHKSNDKGKIMNFIPNCN